MNSPIKKTKEKNKIRVTSSEINLADIRKNLEGRESIETL